MRNRQAEALSMTAIVIIVVVVVVLGFILISKGVNASNVITSATGNLEGCKPTNIPVSIKGSVYTKDKATFGVVTEPDKIDVAQVTAGGKMLSIFGRGITSQDFTWNIKLIDDFNGNVVAVEGGKNNHPGGNVLVEDKYSLNFFIPDNDCNNALDNFEGDLVFNVRTDDGQDNTISKKISFVNGRYVRS